MIHKNVLKTLLSFLMLLISLNTQASNNHFMKPSDMVEANLVGSGQYTFLFLPIYTASLFAKEGRWSAEQPFALELEYHRHLKGLDIAKRSVEEMRKNGFKDEFKLAAWFNQMKAIFPDVQDNSKIIGIFHPQLGTQFLHDGQVIGLVQDQDFGLHFFAIWLGDNTSDSKLRKKLLGL